jgi:hypothetical protein
MLTIQGEPMARKLLVVLMLSIPVLIFGQTVEDFRAVVDFTTTLGDLDRAAENGDPLPNRFVIIEGAVASRKVVNAETENYLGELELVSGEWLGVERVVRYQCVLRLVGPEFASAIPARRSRRANPNEIPLNTRILAVAKAEGVRKLENGAAVPILRVYYIRKIQ